MMRRSLYYRYKWWEQKRRYRGWERNGKPLPPPHFVKQLTIKEFARRFALRVLIETGTYKGDMVRAMVGGFDHIYSIEVAEALFRDAQEKFRCRPNIHLRLGDSGVELPKVLAELREPAIFWLDGHYTGAHAGKGDLNTPITRELAAIAAHPVQGHVILIDDARLFTGSDDYPLLESLREAATRLFPSAKFAVVDDIIRIYPPATVPDADPMNPRKPKSPLSLSAFVKRLLLVVVPFLLMALLVEGGTRLFFAMSGHRPTSQFEFRLTRPPPYKDASFFSEAFVREQFRQPGGWHLQKELGFFLPGDLHGQFYNVENNQRRTTAQPMNSEHTVFIIGGSAVYCSEVPDDLTIPSLLQAELNRRFGARYRVENLGVAGATMREELDRLKTVKLAPGDIVIFYDGANDITQALFYRNAQGRLVETSDSVKQFPLGTRVVAYVHRKLRKHSMFVRLFLNPFDPARTPPHLRPGADLRPLVDALRKECYETLLAAERHTREAGGRFAHFVQPTLFALSKRSTYESQLLKNPYIVPAGMETAFAAGIPALRETQRQLTNQIESYDATGLLQARQPGEEFFLDYCHVNHEANRIVVQFILDKVFAVR